MSADAGGGTVRHSPLDAAHRALGARMVDFGGWEMPLSYDTGTLTEHRACRGGAAVFDVSHLGSVALAGPEAFDRLQAALSNDLRKISVGRAQYTHLLDPEDGSVTDDLIVLWLAPDQFQVMPNASNTAGVIAALGGAAVDVTETRALLALQGPEAKKRLGELCPEAAGVGRFRVSRATWGEIEVIVAGTGYTGEDGVEVAMPAADAPRIWDDVLDAGFTPAGLGARDTLRLEAALPLHGHELGPGITPLQANLGGVVGWDKSEFRGRDALVAERERGVSRLLGGLAIPGRRPPRQGQTVLVGDKEVGIVTSGNFSPTLETGIALAFLPPELTEGAEVTIDARGRELPARVVATPFVS